MILKMEVKMDDRLVGIKAKMFKYQIKGYQLARFLNIQEYLLSRMLNGHIKLPGEIEKKIEVYFEQIEENQLVANAK